MLPKGISLLITITSCALIPTSSGPNKWENVVIDDPELIIEDVDLSDLFMVLVVREGRKIKLCSIALPLPRVIHKAAPGAYKNVEVNGDGRVGTIKHINLGDASPFKTMSFRTDAINRDAFTLDYSVIDGDILMGFIESVENHLTIVSTADGGSTTKTVATFHTKGDAVVPEENIKFANEQNTTIFKAIEAYLIANESH